MPSQDLNILRQALQNFVFLVSESDLEKCEDLFRFAKVFTKYFHIVHIVGCRVESCMIYRRVLVESTLQSFFILFDPKYRFRLLKQLFSNPFTSFLNLFFWLPKWRRGRAAAIFTALLKMRAQIFVATVECEAPISVRQINMHVWNFHGHRRNSSHNAPQLQEHLKRGKPPPPQPTSYCIIFIT